MSLDASRPETLLKQRRTSRSGRGPDRRMGGALRARFVLGTATPGNNGEDSTDQRSYRCPSGYILGVLQDCVGDTPNIARSPWNTTILGVGESYQVVFFVHSSECARCCRVYRFSTPPPRRGLAQDQSAGAPRQETPAARRRDMELD